MIHAHCHDSWDCSFNPALRQFWVLVSPFRLPDHPQRGALRCGHRHEGHGPSHLPHQIRRQWPYETNGIWYLQTRESHEIVELFFLTEQIFFRIIWFYNRHQNFTWIQSSFVQYRYNVETKTSESGFIFIVCLDRRHYEFNSRPWIKPYRLNMELDLQSLFRLLCTALLIGWDPATPPPLPPHLGSYTRALLVSQDRRHLFVTP